MNHFITLSLALLATSALNSCGVEIKKDGAIGVKPDGRVDLPQKPVPGRTTPGGNPSVGNTPGETSSGEATRTWNGNNVIIYRCDFKKGKSNHWRVNEGSDYISHPYLYTDGVVTCNPGYTTPPEGAFFPETDLYLNGKPHTVPANVSIPAFQIDKRLLVIKKTLEEQFPFKLEHEPDVNYFKNMPVGMPSRCGRLEFQFFSVSDGTAAHREVRLIWDKKTGPDGNSIWSPVSHPNVPKALSIQKSELLDAALFLHCWW